MRSWASRVRVQCDRCGWAASFVVRASSPEPAMYRIGLKEAMKHAGWGHDSHDSGDLCPKCVSGEANSRNIRLKRPKPLSGVPAPW